jgi:hypothetical protein
VFDLGLELERVSKMDSKGQRNSLCPMEKFSVFLRNWVDIYLSRSIAYLAISIFGLHPASLKCFLKWLQI